MKNNEYPSDCDLRLLDDVRKVDTFPFYRSFTIAEFKIALAQARQRKEECFGIDGNA